MPPAGALWLWDEGGLIIPPAIDPGQAQQTWPGLLPDGRVEGRRDDQRPVICKGNAEKHGAM